MWRCLDVFFIEESMFFCVYVQLCVFGGENR